MSFAVIETAVVKMSFSRTAALSAPTSLQSSKLTEAQRRVSNVKRDLLMLFYVC
jgi:hypothetical protein